MENRITQSAGFTLIELILTIVLIGIIGVFTSLFVYTGIRGYQTTRLASEGALQAQIAMDRISLELRDITSLAITPDDTDLLSYKSEVVVSGTRKLKCDDSNQKAILISVDNGSNYYELLKNISECNFHVTSKNLDHDLGPVDEVELIELTFNLDGIGKEFKSRIFPRHLVERKY
jgi:prepilin-type N-terminal cleavage/methylation domain-containing protein